MDGSVVIGAGVVGLAVARALALRGEPVLVLEAAPGFGRGVSSRSSEVIHAGLYHPPGSLKARTCVEGKRRLYAYASERGLAHRRTGKLVVATEPAQVERLAMIRDNARACGVDDIEPIEAAEARRIEPAVRCEAALWSPSSGIVDAHALMAALAADVEAMGGQLVYATPVERVDPEVDGWRLAFGGREPGVLRCTRLFVAAGLSGLQLARMALPEGVVPPNPPAFARGHYFGLVGCPPPFSRLVYPLPEADGLGIHATVDLAGRVRFGPDVDWTADPADLSVDPDRAPAFERAVRRYWPGLPDGALAPDYVGVRPKLVGPEGPATDFLVLDGNAHDRPPARFLLGIESPGLTAALALAEVAVAPDGG